jgi:hypothetical protein
MFFFLLLVGIRLRIQPTLSRDLKGLSLNGDLKS